jgi:hypothetical protein|tara:strand:- start:106 stop:465 length:360 start_codon:yes stop_codon:yes gene_type:complete
MIDMTENDFGVILRPVLPDGEEWEGDVQVSVFSNLMPKVDDETHAQLMFLAYKLAAMVQYCTDNPDFDDVISDYATEMVDDLGLIDPDSYEIESSTSRVTSREGNVITLDFNTKCEGEG